MRLQDQRWCLWAIGVAVLFPLFFQLTGAIYRDVNPVIDSQGILKTLPLPISLLTFVLLPVMLVGNLARVRPALLVVAGMVAACGVSLWLGADGVTPQQRKLMMVLQVLLPMGGLLLGQLVDDRDRVVARAFLYVLTLVVPCQLLATWWQGGLMLTHYLYAFSIYSHFQYVTLVFLCAYAYAFTALWDRYRLWLCVLSVPMAIYALSSLSFLTIFAFAVLCMVLIPGKLWQYRTHTKVILIAACLIAVVALGGAIYFGKMDGQRASVEGEHGAFYGKFKSLLEGKIPLNVQERLDDWKLFGNGIVESGRTVLVGHPQPMPREIRSSPHNWYVDMAYTFGLVGVLPILALIAYTVGLCWKQRATLQAPTWWLVAIVMYLVVIDSNFKVTLRQPYPGIFAYFLWGMLLSRLRLPAVTRVGA